MEYKYNIPYKRVYPIRYDYCCLLHKVHTKKNNAITGFVGGDFHHLFLFTAWHIFIRTVREGDGCR